MSQQLTITRDDDAGTMHIAFSEPIRFAKGELHELFLKEPTARQVREAEKVFDTQNVWASRQAYELKLIGLVAGIGNDATDALPIGAANYAAVFLHDFIEAGGGDAADESEEVPDAAVSIDLDTAITFGGTSYHALELREPLGSEIRKARMLLRQAGNLFENRRAQMALVTMVSGLPAPVIDALPIRKLNEAGRVLSRFTMAGRPTGKT